MGDRLTDTNMIAMVQSRMGWNMDDPKSPLRRLFCFTLKEKNVVGVFMLMGSRWVVLEDDDCLFPSDQLVAQIRVFVGPKPST